VFTAGLFLTKNTAVFNSKLLNKRKRENQLQDQLKDDRSAGMVNKIGPFGLWRLFLFTIINKQKKKKKIYRPLLVGPGPEQPR